MNVYPYMRRANLIVGSSHVTVSVGTLKLFSTQIPLSRAESPHDQDSQ